MIWTNKHNVNNEIVSSNVDLGKFTLYVHRHMLNCHDQNLWLASCRNLFSCFELKSKTIGCAKVEALSKLSAILDEAKIDIMNSVNYRI